MNIKNLIRKIGFRRIYNPHSYQLEYYFGKKKLFEIFDKKALPAIVEASNNALLNQLYALQNILPDLHQKTFSKYKGSFEGRDVVLMASGPTLAAYNQDKYINNAIHIGVNKVLTYYENLDFYFMGDWTATQRYGIEDVIRQSGAQKFFQLGVLCDEYGTTSFSTPLDFAKECNASMYFVMHYASHQIIQPDISRHPLFGYASIIIPAFHFALYCRPKRIYLVGCDCSTSGYFHDTKTKNAWCDLATLRLKEEWRRMALFAKYYYPDVEIISINPVGLKGMFRDEYL